MKINTVCLLACLLASVASAAAAEQHLVNSPVLMNILKTVDEAPTDEHLLDVTLRLLKGICECMTETLLVKEERTNRADTSAIPYTTSMDGATRNTTWKEFDLYQKIYNNTCFNLRNELAVKVDVDQLERTKNENDTQSSFKTWTCGKQHEITTERIVMASTSMSPVLNDRLRPQLDNVLFKTLIVTKDHHTYKLRRRNLFGRNIPVTRNKKKHSIIVIVTLHPPKSMSRNGKVPNENVGSISEINRNKLDEIELNRTMFSKSPVDIDIFDTDFNLTEKESDENNQNGVPKCVLLSIYKFLTESETKNNTKVFKLLRRKKSIKIYIEVMTSQGDGNYSRMCCDGDAITASCTQQYISEHLDIDESQDNVQNRQTPKSMPKNEERNSDYKDTIAKIKNLLKLYDNELQKSTYFGKRVVVDNKLEGPKHGGHVDDDAHASVIDIFAKHKSVANQVTKSTNIDKVEEFANQIFSTTASSIQGIYTFKGFYDDELWDNTIPQETKTTDSTINVFQSSVPTKSNLYFLNIKKYPSEKEYSMNTIKREDVLPKGRTTRSTETNSTFEMGKLSDTDEIHETMNPYSVIPLTHSLVLSSKKNTSNQTTDVKESSEYLKADKGSKIASTQENTNLSGTSKNQYPEIFSNFQTGTEKSNTKGTPSEKNVNDKTSTTSITYNNKLISKERLDFETDTEIIFKDTRELKMSSDFIESFTENNLRSTQTSTKNVQQKSSDSSNNYLPQIRESSRIKSNDINARIYETTKSYAYETSTEFYYDTTVHNSQDDMDSNEKYKHKILNSIIESVHPQQFTDYKKKVNPTMDIKISKDSLLLNNFVTTHSPDVRIDSRSSTTVEPSGEYIDFSSDSGEKHVNKSFEKHSTYEDSKRLSVNLFESMIPLEPIIASNNVSENLHFTTEYETLAEKITESSVKFSFHLENSDLSKKYNYLTNLTGSLFPAQTIKDLTIKNMNPIPEVIDNNLTTTEDVVATSSINKAYMTPNLKHYTKDNFEYTTIPVFVVTDKNNVFEKKGDKMLQGNESGSKENLDENEVHLKNDSDGSMLESKNEIPVHLKERSHVDLMDRVTSKTGYINVEQLEFVTEPSEINESSNNVKIEEKLETTSPSIERTTIISEVINGDYSMTTSENDVTIKSNRNLNEDKSDTSTETNDGITIFTGKSGTTTENIENSSHDKNIIEENSYGTTATTIDTTTQCIESLSDISIENKEKDNLEEHSATTNRETPEISSERNQMDYLVQTADGHKDNDSVNAPESHISAPMSLKKVEPLVVERESSQIVELLSTTEKDTASSENFNQLLETYTLEPTYLTNVQPLLKIIISQPKNDLTSASEEVTIINKEDVQASESYTSTPTLALNVKPLVYTKGKHLSKLTLTATTAPITLINAKHLMTGEEERNDIDNTITNTPESTGENQMNASATDKLLVHEESAQIPELHKSTSTSTHVELLVTSTDGKYIKDSVSASDQWMVEHEEITTMKTYENIQDTEFIRSFDTQDIEMVTGTSTSTKQAEYVDHSVESGEKHVNVTFPTYSTYEGQKHPSAKGFQSPVELITTSVNFTNNVNFTTNHQNVEVTESSYSVLFSGHSENIVLSDKDKNLLENVTGASFYTPNTKSNKSLNLEDPYAIINPANKNISTKKSNTFHQVSEFDASTSNAEYLVNHREKKLTASIDNKLMATDKGLVQDPESYTIAPTLSTNVDYSGTGKHEQQGNKLVSANNKIPDNKQVTVPASVFEFDSLVSTIPTNVVPLFTNGTDKLVNSSISAKSMNVTLNNKDLVQAPESRTKDTIDIKINSVLEQIHTNSKKDLVESVIEKLEETSTIIAQVKELYSTLFYTTTSHPIESKGTSMLTSTQTTISFNDVITKKYDSTREQIGETHTKPLNSFNEKSIREHNLIRSTTDIDTVMKYYDAIRNNSSLKSLESDTEETLFNEIENEDSAENDKKTKGNLNEKTFNEKPKTTLRNSIDKLPTTTKHNLETSTDTLSTVRTKLSSRVESVNLDIKEDNSVETLVKSTLPSFSERTSSIDYKVKNNIVNEQFALRNSDTSMLVTDTLDHHEITTLYTPEIIHNSELGKFANNIAAPNLRFRPGSQQLSYHEYVNNITNTLSFDHNKSTDKNGVIIPKIKQSIKLTATNISEDSLKKIKTDNNSAINGNIPPQILFNHSKNQEKENYIINQEKQISGREPSVQYMTNSRSELSPQLQQTPQTYLLFIKNSENTQLKGTNFNPEGYNNTSLKQNTETEKVALELRSTTSSVQDNSKVNEVTILKNNRVTSSDDWIKQDSSTNVELKSRENKPVSPKFKDQERKEMNVLTTLTLKEATAVRNSELNEFTKLINENERVTVKDDIELGNSTKLKLKSKENIFEYARYKYQEGKMPNDESTLISEDILLTTLQNSLLETESLYPITTNSYVDKVTSLAQERDQTTLKKVMEQFSGTKGEQENNKNKLTNTDLKGQDCHHAHALSTLIPQTVTDGMSAIMEENLSKIETVSPLQFISENSKGNEITTMRKKQTIHKNDTEEDHNTKSKIGSTENESEYTKLNRQIHETLLALVTSNPHKIKEMDSEVSEITTLAKNNEQAALMNYFEKNGKTKTDLNGTGNKVVFTGMEDQSNKPYVLFTAFPEQIKTVVKTEVNEITTLKKDTSETIEDYKEQNRAIKEKLGDKRNESKHTNFKDIIENIEEISTYAKKTTTSISTILVNYLSKTETTTNVALGTDIPNYDEFIIPLAVTDSTAQEMKSEMNHVNESELVTPKSHIEQHRVNKAELEAQGNKSNYTELKVMEMTTWRNENKKPMLENHMTQGSVIKTELEVKENKSEYRESNNQKSEKANEMFTPIAKTNSDVILAEVVKNLSKTETVSTVVPKGTYLPSNYEFTLPVAETENIMYGLYTSTTKEIRKEFYSEVNETMTLRDENTPISPKDRVTNSTENINLVDQEGEKNNETFIPAVREITAGILSKALKSSPTIETKTNVTEVPYYDKFSYQLAVTEDIINAVAALTQEDIKLEVNSEANAINTWQNKTYSDTPKDHIEQYKSKIKENEKFYPLSTFIPEEKFEVNKIITLINGHKKPSQKNQIEQNHENNANLKIKENKSTHTDFRNEQDERWNAIPASVAQEITNTFAMVVEDLNEIETSTDLPGYLFTGIYNSDVLNYSEFTLPFLVTEDINTSKLMQKATDAKMTLNTEHVNQGNLLHSSRVANNDEVNKIEISPKTNFVIQGDFTGLSRIKSTLSTGIEKERNIDSFTFDYNKGNNEYTNYEDIASNIEVNSHILSDNNAQISFISPTEEKNTESLVNGEVNIISTKSTTTEMQSFMRETVPQIISKETSFPFNNFVTDLPMLEDYHGTIPVTVNIFPNDTRISTLPNLGEKIINNIEDEKELFVITLPKPLLEKVKMTNHAMYEPRAYDFEENHTFMTGEGKSINGNDILKIDNTNIDSIMKKYKVSISALNQKIVHGNGTNTTTTLNKAEESVVFTDNLKLPEELLLQDTDTDNIQTNIVIKKPKVTTIGMKYPTLIYSPVNYLNKRLNAENNNLVSNHDSLSDTNDSLQKKYSKEADEVLSELAAVWKSNCNSTNRISPSKMCYTNILTRIVQGNNNRLADDPVIAKSKHINVSKSGAVITSAVENVSFAAQQTSPVAEKIMSKDFTNLTHSDTNITEVETSKLTTYAKETNSSLNSEYTKDDNAFKKAIIIASAFKNLDFLFKNSENTSLQKKTKPLYAESSPMKVQFPTMSIPDKTSRDSYSVTVAINNKYGSLHLNDSKIYYVPFISNAAVNKNTSETLSNKLALANLKIDNVTSNNMNTAKSLDRKDNKIQSMSLTLDSKTKPQSYKIDKNLRDPTKSTQYLYIKERKTFDVNDKNIDIKTMDNGTISTTKTSEEVTSNNTNKSNKIAESPTLNNTFNNSVLRLTNVNLSSPVRKYGSVEIDDDPSFLQKRVVLSNITKKGEITNENMFYTTPSDKLKKYNKNALFNATESSVNDNVNLKRDNVFNMDDILPSTVDVSTPIIKAISESAKSGLTNFKTAVLVNKSTRAFTKNEEFDHFRSKDNIHNDKLLNFNNTRIDNGSTKSKYVTPVLSHRYFSQLFAKTVLSKELKETITSPKPVTKQFSIVPDKVSIYSVYFPAFTKATHEVTNTPINAGTGESYFSETNIQDLWNSFQDIIDTSASRDVNTIQVNRSVINVETTNTIFHSSKTPLPVIEADFNDHYGTSSTKKLSRYSYKQLPEDFDKYKNIKYLFTNEEVIQKQSKKDITKGYVPIMTFTTTPKTSLITKPVGNIIKRTKMYNVPSLRIGFDLYTTETNRQNTDTKPERRNDNSSLTNYTFNSKTNNNKSTFSEASIESNIASKLTKQISNYDSVSSKASGKEKNVLKAKFKSKSINNSKLDIDNAITNIYAAKQKNKETVKNSTLMKHSSVVGNMKHEHSAMADDMLRILVQATHSYSNIRPKATTERSTAESVLYSLLSNKAITRSTKKITRHRNTIHPKFDDSTTTGPRRTTVRKKRRRTTKRIVYNTYEPTMYEDLDIAFTDDLQEKGTQVKPTRANGEEILGEILKSSDHVHIGDATAILPWPVYFPTPSTTRQVNVRGKIELAHIVRQTKIKNTESASNKSINSVGNTDIKIKSRPTRLPAFNNLYRNLMDATERMTSLPETHIDSVPVIVSITGPKPTRLVNFNHYETITTTEPTRLLENGIRIEDPVQSKQFIYRNGPIRNAFPGTLLPPETSKPRKRNIHRSVMRKAEKKLTFYQGLGKIYEKPTHFPIFGDVYKRTAPSTKNVKNSVIYDNIIKAATNENNIAEDKVTAFMKATRSSNKKILLFRKNDPRLSKINQFQTKQLMSDITYPPSVNRGPTARFAVKQFQLGKKSNYKIGMGAKHHLRAKFVPRKLEVARTTDSNVGFTVKDLITTDAQKPSDIIKNIINKPQRIKGMLLDPLDPRIKTKLYPVKVIPKYKVKKVYHSAAEKNLLTENPKELILDNMNRMATARIHFFDELTRNNKKTYIVHSAKPSLSRQILLRPKFANIDNAVRITQVPPIETTKKETHSKLIPTDLFENRMPIEFNLAHNNKKPIRRLASNMRDNNLNILEEPLYFPLMNKKARGNSETKYGMSTRGFLVPEEKYFLEAPMESFREAAIPMRSPAPYSRYQMHPVTPLKPRRSRRTIFFLSPTASYIEYFK